MNTVDVIIIGSGIAGLYAAYQIKRLAANTTFLILEKNPKKWIQNALGIPKETPPLNITAIRDYYWNDGTHYYTPLNTREYKNRPDFIRRAQNPMKGIVVVGEMVSRDQGWVEGALESVDAVITRYWVTT